MTILELGASATAWADCSRLGTDDWIVVAQQPDESDRAFAQRVRLRARRLQRHAALESIDIYAASHAAVRVRRLTVVDLGRRVTNGGRLTVWSGASSESAAELNAILTQYGPLLATRQVELQHRRVDAEERSGVRHAIPTPPAGRSNGDAFDFEAVG